LGFLQDIYSLDPIMKKKLAILSTFVEKLLKFGKINGLNSSEMRKAAGLPKDVVFDPEKWLPIECSMNLWAFLMRSLKDPGVPVRVAQSFRIEDYHAFGFAVMTSRNVGEALDRAVRYSGFFSNSGVWEIKTGGKIATVAWRRDLPSSLGLRVANENTLAEFVNSLRQVTGGDFRPERVVFMHSCPVSLEAHEAHFQAPLIFDGTANMLTFSREWLDVPLKQPNPELAAFLEQYLYGRLEDLNPTSSWSEKVRKMLLEELPTGVFTAVSVARRLALSERSLRRYLSAEGTTYRDIVSSVRLEHAEYLLTDTYMPISEIAFILGYSDVAAFSRAFRRRMGDSPRDFRSMTSN
jgi:AraC-like DNA-binding protein